jgi:hypothetical protein
MPRIFDEIVECVIYIYDSLSDAQAGERQGGSGFLVGIPFQANPDWVHTYFITNQHAIRSARQPVIRINRKDGKVEYFATEKLKWKAHPEGDDISALPFDAFHEDALTLRFIPLDMFITDSLIKREDVGIGDDTFMVGRFINHEGRQRNAPALRFGNIAMMPIEKIERKDGFQQESFLVEMRSIPGYSGSPVFLYSTHAWTDFSNRELEEKSKTYIDRIISVSSLDLSRSIASLRPKGPYLLGIDWCHLCTKEFVRENNGEQEPIQERWIVRSNSGMAGVIPAWKIRELLDTDELVEARRLEDEAVTKRKEQSPVALD